MHANKNINFHIIINLTLAGIGGAVILPTVEYTTELSLSGAIGLLLMFENSSNSAYIIVVPVD